MCGGEGKKGRVGVVCGFNLHSDVLTTNCIIGKRLLINDSEKTRQITIVYVCMGLFSPKHQLNVKNQGRDTSLNKNWAGYHTYYSKIQSQIGQRWGSMSHVEIRNLWEGILINFMSQLTLPLTYSTAGIKII